MNHSELGCLVFQGFKVLLRNGLGKDGEGLLSGGHMDLVNGSLEDRVYVFIFLSVSSFLYFRKSTGILFLIQKTLWSLSFFYSIFCFHCFPLSYPSPSVLTPPCTDFYIIHPQD